jgi:hypothetical protein
MPSVFSFFCSPVRHTVGEGTDAVDRAVGKRPEESCA